MELILKIKGINTEGRIYLIKGDLNKLSDIEKVFEMSFKFKKPIRSVMHFAGLKSVYDSVKEPLNYWENNINGTINLLKAMKKNNCNNIVFSSSATIYESKIKKKIDSMKRIF